MMSNGLKSFQVFSFSWSEVAPTLTRIIPPLLHSEHKGAMGRIGVLGGSKDYTGAPFYAADAALKFGGDLSSVFCSQQAAVPIKCYSPELIVTPLYRDESFEYFKFTSSTNINPPTSFCEAPASLTAQHEADIVKNEIARAESIIREGLPRLHTLVIGPGLGRSEHVGEVVLSAIAAAKQQNLFTVIDADGLWVVNKNPSSIYGYTRCVITPNAMEFGRLVDAILADISENILQNCTDSRKRSYYELLLNELSSGDEVVKTRALSLALGGVTVLKKAENDIISSGSDVFILKESGSPRRCGGQGDILAGCVAVALHWQNKMSNEIAQLEDSLSFLSNEVRESGIDLFDQAELTNIQSDKRIVLTKSFGGGKLSTSPTFISTSAGRERFGNILATVLASAVVKRASQFAFAQKKRSMTAPDVLNHIGAAFESLVGLA